MKTLAKITTTLLFFATCSFANWTGSTSEPESMKKIDGKPFYVITSADELAWFAALVNSGSTDINAVLGNDIVFGNDKNTVGTVSWTPIGHSETKQFAGVFDGAGYTIYGLYVNRSTAAGFIGYLAKSGIVKNVYMDKGTVSVELSGKPYAGGIVAINYGIVQKSKNLNSVSNNQNPSFQASSEKNIYSGGIVGSNEGVILDCNNGGTILAKSKNIAQPVSFAGGIAGYNTGEIHNCYNQGSVTSEDTTIAYGNFTLNMSSYSGGITGYNSGTISNCRNSQDINSRIKSSLSNGESNSGVLDAQAKVYSGGIVGFNTGNVFKCYNDASKIYSESSSYAKSGQYYSQKECVVGGSTRAVSYSYSGGIGGYNNGDIYDCYSDYTGSASAQVSSEYCKKVKDENAISWCEKFEGTKDAQSYYGGIVGLNVSGGHTKSSYYKTEYWLNNTKVVGTAENMQKDQFAWILNTCNGTEENSGVWTRGTEGYPTFANEDSLAIYKIVFNDDGAKSNRYTNYQGNVSFPDSPEPADGYVFSGWFNSEGIKVKPSTVFNADETVNAVYVNANDVFWTITFYNAAPADTVLDSKSYQHGSIVTYGGAIPTLVSTAQYTYTFKGWDVEPTNAFQDFNYHAIYDSTIRSYAITFNNTDGSKIESATFEYGEMPSCSKTPTREATAEWKFSHKGWKPALDYVTGDAIYTAIYDSSKVEYKVVFMNGMTVIDEQMVPYGDAAVAPTNVTREGYRFVGWNTTFSSITESLTVKALFEEIAVYAVKVVGLNGEKIDSVGVEENGTYVLPTAPQKDGYNFIGFYKGELKIGNSGNEITVNENTTINAVYETKTFVVKFVNGDTELQSEEFAYGSIPKYRGDNPAKTATAKWTYSFKEWSPEISSVTETVIYAAVFDSVVNKYVISFMYGDAELQRSEVAYGIMPIAPIVSLPENTSQYTYSFAGWDKDVVAVTESTTYAAIIDSVINKYEISFKNYDGTLIKNSIYAYGSTVEKPADPTKTATAKYIYTFKDWTPTIANVTANAVYKAVFDSTIRSYTITFVNGSGSLQSHSVAYGDSPKYTGKTPTKASTKIYSYEFTGWSPKIEKVVGEATYHAVFDSTKLSGIMDNQFANLEMSVSVISRNIQISAAPVGSIYAILDMQGRVLKKGRVVSANFNIAMPQAGNYLIRIGNQTQRISVK